MKNTAHTCVKKIVIFSSISLIAILGLSGCTDWNRKPEEAVSIPSTSVQQTRVYYGDCITPMSGEGAFIPALAATIIPSLVGSAWGALGDYLEEESKDKPFTSTGKLNTDISPKEVKGCIQIVNGEFPHVSSDISDDDYFNKSGNLNLGFKDDALKVRFFSHRKIHLLSEPSFFIELAIVNSSDKKAWAAYPTTVIYNKSLEDGGTLAEKRPVVVSISFAKPGEKPSDSKVSAVLAIGEIKTGYAKVYTKANAYEPERSNWFPAPEINEKEKQPLTISASVTETKPGSQVLKFIAGVVTGSKTDASKLISDSLIAKLPSNAAASELAEYQTNLNATNAYLSTLATLQSAFISYCAPSTTTGDALKLERIKYSKELLDAEIKEKIEAKKSGKNGVSLPFVTISSGAALSDICSKNKEVLGE